MFFTTPGLASPAAVALAFHPLRRLSEPSREAPINPSIVVIVVILTIIFFLSGCLHLLIRCIVRSPRRDPNSIVTLTALQGQLQQLFHLHDSGVEQAFIDTLPVFFYKSVKGLKEGADCAVCLCEFQAEDRLRLLPKCSHAFHLDCIDTWLLSHSTCPLCRRSLLPEEPAVTVVPAGAGSHGPLSFDASSRSSDSGGDGTAADSHLRGEEAQVDAPTVSDADAVINGGDHDSHGVRDVIKRLRDRDSELVSAAAAGASVAFPQEHPQSQYAGKVLTVQLGRFKVVDNVGGDGGSETKHINGSRRSYSVGSYEYVLDPCSLEVVIAPTPLHRRSSTPRRPKAPGHRTTLSECTAEDLSSAAHAAPADLLEMSSRTPFHEDLAFFRRAGSPCSRDDRCLGHTRRGSELELEALGRRRRHVQSYVEDEVWVSIDLKDVDDEDHGCDLQQPAALPPSSHGYSSVAPSSTHSDRRRAHSFRHPLSSESVKLKASASRRSLSETELPPCGWAAEPADPASFSGAQLVTPSTQLSNYNVPRAGGPSLAKRTINWLVGKQQKWIGLSFLHDNVLPHR